VTVYLVRHAHAGSRSRWDGEDSARPLSGKGRRQAEHLADLLEGRSLGQVVSSPSRRCVETVEPLAGRRGLRIITDDALLEGADPLDTIALLHELATGDGAVLASHGDLIPKVIRRLNARGMRTSDANLSQKGSVWELDTHKGKIVAGRYHPPG
jgi:8-oxo-dGTP diphosphatase